MQLRERRGSVPVAAGSLSAELVRACYSTALRSVVANALAVVAFVLVALSEVETAQLVLWVALVAVVLVARALRLRSCMRRADFPEPAGRLSMEYAIGATLTGALFGGGFILFGPHLDFARQLLLTLAMSGMAAGAALAMAASRWAYAGYTMASLGAALVWFALDAVHSQNLTAIATLFIIAAYLMVMVAIHAGARRFVYETISLQLDNDRFVAALERYSATLSRDREEYRAASLTDALTGVANRRSFDEALVQFWQQAIANGDRIGCLLIDVDLFKPYNDTLGHAEGDVCLRRLASAMDSVSKRSGDFLARYGGEEFVLLAPNTTPAGTLYLAEAIREGGAVAGDRPSDLPVGCRNGVRGRDLDAAQGRRAGPYPGRGSRPGAVWCQAGRAQPGPAGSRRWHHDGR